MDTKFGGLPEILLSIYRSCDDFHQVLSLASTCRTFHNAWLLHAPVIIWPLGMRSVIAFSEALEAVRATALVKDALAAGQLPPSPFPLAELDGSLHKPTLTELEAVFSLRHLVLCLEHSFNRWDCWYFGEQYHARFETVNCCLANQRADRRGTWRSYFHKAVYKVLTAGALLARAYHEPFLSVAAAAPEVPSNFLHSFLRGHRIMAEDFESVDDWGEYPWFSAAEVAYLARFPAYDFAASIDTKTAALGEFANWLANGHAIEPLTQRPAVAASGRLRSSDFPDNQQWLLLEIMRLLFTLEHLRIRFCNGDGMPSYDRPGRNLEYPDIAFVVKYPTHSRTATIILPGVFRVEVVTMPTLSEQASEFFLIANPALPVREDSALSALSLTVDIPDLLQTFNNMSGRPNRRGEWPAPEPALYPFEFALQKHLGLRFCDEAFEDVRIGGPFHSFLGHSGMYTDEEGQRTRAFNGSLLQWDIRPNWGYQQLY